MNGPDLLSLRQRLHTRLLELPVTARVAGDPNRSLFASLLAGQSAGFGCLPAGLGLLPAQHTTLLEEFFPDALDASVLLVPLQRPVEAIPEWDDLYKLLTDHRAGRHDAELWAARVIATACAGRDHLWQDLGFNNRTELSTLITHNFPDLAAANVGDMKWKKFLYRQFCAIEGIYVCPAPSCGVCADHAKCFGPEE